MLRMLGSGGGRVGSVTSKIGLSLSSSSNCRLSLRFLCSLLDLRKPGFGCRKRRTPIGGGVIESGVGGPDGEESGSGDSVIGGLD